MAITPVGKYELYSFSEKGDKYNFFGDVYNVGLQNFLVRDISSNADINTLLVKEKVYMKSTWNKVTKNYRSCTFNYGSQVFAYKDADDVAEETKSFELYDVILKAFSIYMKYTDANGVVQAITHKNFKLNQINYAYDRASKSSNYELTFSYIFPFHDANGVSEEKQVLLTFVAENVNFQKYIQDFYNFEISGNSLMFEAVKYVGDGTDAAANIESPVHLPLSTIDQNYPNSEVQSDMFEFNSKTILFDSPLPDVNKPADKDKISAYFVGNGSSFTQYPEYTSNAQIVYDSKLERFANAAQNDLLSVNKSSQIQVTQVLDAAKKDIDSNYLVSGLPADLTKYCNIDLWYTNFRLSLRNTQYIYNINADYKNDIYLLVSDTNNTVSSPIDIEVWKHDVALNTDIKVLTIPGTVAVTDIKISKLGHIFWLDNNITTNTKWLYIDGFPIAEATHYDMQSEPIAGPLHFSDLFVFINHPYFEQDHTNTVPHYDNYLLKFQKAQTSRLLSTTPISSLNDISVIHDMSSKTSAIWRVPYMRDQVTPFVPTTQDMRVHAATNGFFWVSWYQDTGETFDNPGFLMTTSWVGSWIFPIADAIGTWNFSTTPYQLSAITTSIFGSPHHMRTRPALSFSDFDETTHQITLMLKDVSNAGYILATGGWHNFTAVSSHDKNTYFQNMGGVQIGSVLDSTYVPTGVFDKNKIIFYQNRSNDANFGWIVEFGLATNTLTRILQPLDFHDQGLYSHLTTDTTGSIIYNGDYDSTPAAIINSYNSQIPIAPTFPIAQFDALKAKIKADVTAANTTDAAVLYKIANTSRTLDTIYSAPKLNWVSFMKLLSLRNNDFVDVNGNVMNDGSLLKDFLGYMWWIMRDVKIPFTTKEDPNTNFQTPNPFFTTDPSKTWSPTLPAYFKPEMRTETMRIPQSNSTSAKFSLSTRVQTVNNPLRRTVDGGIGKPAYTSNADANNFFKIDNYFVDFQFIQTQEALHEVDKEVVDTDDRGNQARILESANMDVAGLDLEDYLPEALIKVFPYRAIYGEKNRDIIAANGVTIIRLAQVGVDDFLNLEYTTKGDRFMYAFAAVTNNTTITASSGLTTFSQELRKVKQFELITSNYFDQIEEKPDFFTIGHPFDFEEYKSGNQQVYYASKLTPTYPEVAQELMDEGVVIDDVSRIATATLTNVTELTSGYKSKIYFVKDKTISDVPINEIGESGITLEVDNNILISSIKGKGYIQPIETDGTEIGDPVYDEINFNVFNREITRTAGGFTYSDKERHPQMMPMKISPISVQDKIQIYNDWMDWNFIIPHYIIRHFAKRRDLNGNDITQDAQGNPISYSRTLWELPEHIFADNDSNPRLSQRDNDINQWKQRHFTDFLLLMDIIQVSEGFADNWRVAPYKETDGKLSIDPEFYIGHGGYRVASFITKNPKEVVDGMIENYKATHPDFLSDKIRYQMFFGILASLSHIVYSSYCFGGGRASFNKVYLPWFLEVEGNIQYVAGFEKDFTVTQASVTADTDGSAQKKVFFLGNKGDVSYTKKELLEYDVWSQDPNDATKWGWGKISKPGTLKFIAKTNYFRNSYSDNMDNQPSYLYESPEYTSQKERDDETGADRRKRDFVSLPTALDISNLKVLAADRIITTTEFEPTLKEVSKTLLPGDVNFQTSDQMNYVVYSPNTNFKDFYLDSESGLAELVAGTEIQIFLPSRWGDSVFDTNQKIIDYVDSLGIPYDFSQGAGGIIGGQDAINNAQRIEIKGQSDASYGTDIWTVVALLLNFSEPGQRSHNGWLLATALGYMHSSSYDYDWALQQYGMTPLYRQWNSKTQSFVDKTGEFKETALVENWYGNYTGGAAGYSWNRTIKINDVITKDYVANSSHHVLAEYHNYTLKATDRTQAFKNFIEHSTGTPAAHIQFKDTDEFELKAIGHGTYIEHRMKFDYWTVSETYPTPITVRLSKPILTNDFSFIKTPVVFDKWAWRKQLWKKGAIPSQRKKIHLSAIDGFKIVDLNEIIISSIWGTKFTVHMAGKQSYDFEALNKDDETIAVQRIIIY